jgi:hypothetical protein
VKTHLQSLGASAKEIPVYLDGVRQILQCEKKDDYDTLCYEVTLPWTQSMHKYFYDRQRDDAISA